MLIQKIFFAAAFAAVASAGPCKPRATTSSVDSTTESSATTVVSTSSTVLSTATSTASSTTATTASSTASSTSSSTFTSITSTTQASTSTAASSTIVSTSSSTTSSRGPTQTCQDVSSGSFSGGSQGSWYISDQYTADSKVVAQGTAGSAYSFALIPSQTQFAQVYLNQAAPCGYPPPAVKVKVRFDYQFTGASTGCKIAYTIPRGAANIDTIIDDGNSAGAWQHYEGAITDVQLTYEPLFTVKMSCDSNTVRTDAIRITNIQVYL